MNEETSMIANNAPDTSQYDIEATKKKLFLVPIDFGRKRLFAREKVYATVNAKNGTLNLGNSACLAMGMDKSWYKMAYDSDNRVVAWKIAHNLDREQMESKAWKYVKRNKTNGMITISIKRVLDTFQGLKKQSYKHMEIKSYKDPKSMLDSDSYYYVELNEA